MALKDASGTAAGVATVVGTGAMNLPLGGSAAGTSSAAGTANLNMASGAGSVAGSSTVVGGTALAMVVAGLLAGQATVQGDVHPQGAGTASGTSTATATAAVLVGIAETVAGSSTVTGTAALNQIVTGQAAGQATVSGDWTTTASGTAAGQATVSQLNPIRIRNFSGRVAGTSQMVWSYPRPIFGRATVAGHVVVETHLPPVNAIVAPPKSFRWLQNLQRGDLPVYLSDRNGPVSPHLVFYTTYQKRPNGTRFQVGASKRTPVSGSVGEYYATGRAGELGQPGDWVIRWIFQRSFDGALQTEEMEFRVLDAVLAEDPLDATVRIRKYGWS